MEEIKDEDIQTSRSPVTNNIGYETGKVALIFADCPTDPLETSKVRKEVRVVEEVYSVQLSFQSLHDMCCKAAGSLFLPSRIAVLQFLLSQLKCLSPPGLRWRSPNRCKDVDCA
jgi:hypothetical protein